MTMSTTARPMGQLAARISPSDKRRTNGQVRATERSQWRSEARAEIAALKLVTVR